MPWHAYSFLTVTFFFCCLSYRKRKSLVCPTSWRTKGLGWLGERRRRGGDIPVPGAIQGEGCCTLPTVRQCTEGFLMFPPNSNSVSKNMSNPFKTFFFLNHTSYTCTQSSLSTRNSIMAFTKAFFWHVFPQIIIATAPQHRNYCHYPHFKGGTGLWV